MRGQEGIHIVVVETRERNGEVGVTPPLPEDDTYYAVEFRGERRYYEADHARDVALLACVALRVGGTQQYTGDLTVTALDAVIWMVDPLRQELVGEPWLNKVDMPELVDPDILIRSGDRTFLAANVRNDVSNFLTLTVPREGVFQGGLSAFAYEEDVSAALPPGSILLPGETFIVRLIVFFNDRSFIDYLDVLCAPDGVVTGKSYRIGTLVLHRVGTFSTTSKHFEISGEFGDFGGATGEIRPLTRAARECGVPETFRWAAWRDGFATPTGDGYEISDFR